MSKIILFSDPEGHESDALQVYGLMSMALKKVKNWEKKISYETTDNPAELYNKMSNNCLVFVDYGGLGQGYGGPGALYMECERWVQKAIDDFPSSRFVFILTMGREFYDMSMFDKHNVDSIDRGAAASEWAEFFMEAIS